MVNILKDVQIEFETQFQTIIGNYLNQNNSLLIGLEQYDLRTIEKMVKNCQVIQKLKISYKTKLRISAIQSWLRTNKRQNPNIPSHNACLLLLNAINYQIVLAKEDQTIALQSPHQMVCLAKELFESCSQEIRKDLFVFFACNYEKQFLKVSTDFFKKNNATIVRYLQIFRLLGFSFTIQKM